MLEQKTKKIFYKIEIYKYKYKGKERILLESQYLEKALLDQEFYLEDFLKPFFKYNNYETLEIHIKRKAKTIDTEYNHFNPSMEMLL